MSTKQKKQQQPNNLEKQQPKQPQQPQPQPPQLCHQQSDPSEKFHVYRKPNVDDMNYYKTTSYLLNVTNISPNIYERPLPQPLTTFKASDVQIKILPPEARAVKPSTWEKLVFGQQCIDHMIEIHWTEQDGWQRPQILPVHPLMLHPLCKVFHYAIEAFEGMKAYRGADNKIRLFRPELNMTRLRLSAQRLCCPDFDGQELIKLIKQLVLIDEEWIPPAKTRAALYIRPTLIGVDETVGVLPSTKVILYVVAGPVGPYFSNGFRSISLLASTKYIRAWPGGSGDRKLGANYAPIMLAQRDAALQGFHQLLWLFGDDHQLTEVGLCNIFIVLINDLNGKPTIVTPPLDDGNILPGVTRHSLIELIRYWNEIEVVERRITMKEIELALLENRLLEIFAAGTACIVCPIGHIGYQGRCLKLSPENKYAQRLYQELLDIQYGNKPSPFPNWVQIVDPTNDMIYQQQQQQQQHQQQQHQQQQQQQQLPQFQLQQLQFYPSSAAPPTGQPKSPAPPTGHQHQHPPKTPLKHH